MQVKRSATTSFAAPAKATHGAGGSAKDGGGLMASFMRASLPQSLQSSVSGKAKAGRDPLSLEAEEAVRDLEAALPGAGNYQTSSAGELQRSTEGPLECAHACM